MGCWTRGVAVAYLAALSSSSGELLRASVTRLGPGMTRPKPALDGTDPPEPICFRDSGQTRIDAGPWSALTCQRFSKRRLVAARQTDSALTGPRQVAELESGDKSLHSKFCLI